MALPGAQGSGSWESCVDQSAILIWYLVFPQRKIPSSSPYLFKLEVPS